MSQFSFPCFVLVLCHIRLNIVPWLVSAITNHLRTWQTPRACLLFHNIYIFCSLDQKTNVLLPSCNYMSVPAHFKPIVCFSALLLLDAAHMGRAEKGELQPAQPRAELHLSWSSSSPSWSWSFSVVAISLRFMCHLKFPFQCVDTRCSDLTAGLSILYLIWCR